MTTAAPQHVTQQLLIWKLQKEAIVTVAYPDGWKDKARSIPKFSIAAGSQTPLVKEGDVLPGNTLEEKIAAALVRQRNDVALREADLNRWLEVILPDHQFDMLFSLYYRYTSKKTRQAIALFNAGRNKLACLIPAQCIIADGEPNDGLATRAAHEIRMGFFADYGTLEQVRVYDGPPTPGNLHMVDVATLPFPED